MEDFWSSIQKLTFENEGDVETRLVLPLLRALGYNDSDIGAKVPIVFQQGKRGRRHEADFVVYDGPVRNIKTSLLVAEAKRPGEDLSTAKHQAESYAFSSRAPFLLLTNGIDLEIWQFQPTQESQCVLKAKIERLLACRGTIEALIGKSAAVVHCHSLHYKSVLELANDFTAYEEAELARTKSWRGAINRTLLRATEALPCDSEALLTEFPLGASILAPSGYGKTTLSFALHREALSIRRHDIRAKLPFHFSLSDLAHGGSMIGFLNERLAAHCPWITESALTTLLRDHGAILICDAFDRLTEAARATAELLLRNVNRDYPQIQIFVFSRGSFAPQLPFDVLNLVALDEGQMRAMVEHLAPQEGHHLLNAMPSLLHDLCRHPLLLARTTEYWLREQKFPTRIEVLFRSWLDNLIEFEAGNVPNAFRREQALSALAAASAETDISRTAALEILKQIGQAEVSFSGLLKCGALRIEGEKVHVQHEALADYLRAKALLTDNQQVAHERIMEVALPRDSWFPILLMALCDSAELRTLLWRRLSHGNLLTYFNVLRYRPDISQEISSIGAHKLSVQFLEELHDGVEGVIDGFFPELGQELRAQIAGRETAEFAVTGEVSPNPPSAIYAFHPVSAGAPRINVADPWPSLRDHTITHTSLTSSGLRVDSGRLIGASVLRGALFDLIKYRRLKGGVVWTQERLVSRIRYLQKELRFPLEDVVSFADIKRILASQMNRAVPFLMKDVLDDVAALEAMGETGIRPWWVKSDSAAKIQEYNLSDEALASILDEYYRRAQQAYDEVVRKSFAKVADILGFHSALPVRWQIMIVRRAPDDTDPWSRHYNSSLLYSWMPVESWNDAGADVLFSRKADWNFRKHLDDVQRVLEKLGRQSRQSKPWAGSTGMPSFEVVRQTTFKGETLALSSACEYLVRDLNDVFSELPKRED